MVDIARVNLYGQTIGTFRWDHNRDIALFEYADKFIGSGLEPSPILMPVAPGRVYAFPGIGRETFKGCPDYLPILCRILMAVPCLTDGWHSPDGRVKTPLRRYVFLVNAVWELWNLSPR